MSDGSGGVDAVDEGTNDTATPIPRVCMCSVHHPPHRVRNRRGICSPCLVKACWYGHNEYQATEDSVAHVTVVTPVCGVASCDVIGHHHHVVIYSPNNDNDPCTVCAVDGHAGYSIRRPHSPGDG
jgi:hypothetical protein